MVSRTATEFLFEATIVDISGELLLLFRSGGGPTRLDLMTKSL